MAGYFILLSFNFLIHKVCIVAASQWWALNALIPRGCSALSLHMVNTYPGPASDQWAVTLLGRWSRRPSDACCTTSPLGLPWPSSPLSLQLEHSRRRSRVVHAACLFPGPLSTSTASLWSLVGFAQKRTLNKDWNTERGVGEWGEVRRKPINGLTMSRWLLC